MQNSAEGCCQQVIMRMLGPQKSLADYNIAGP